MLEDDGLFGEETQPEAPNGKAQPAHKRKDFSNTPPMDIEAALVHFDGDRKFMLEMLVIFLSGLQERHSEIRNALGQNDANKLSRLAHNLKGTCLNFGTEPLAILSAELEDMGKREYMEFASTVVEQIEIEIQRFQEFASNLESV